jgi:pimeloyl-ACP methyl ester carboxylesterase
VKVYTEELIWIESEDHLRLDGAVIRPGNAITKPVAVVHVHGFTGRFSHPAHILVARAMTARGYTSISGTNRGFAFGETTSRLRSGEPVVIGAGWERFHELPYDIGPWITFAMSLGFETVVLLGHSFGGPKVVYYMAERDDPRVSALILASPGRTQPLAIASEVIEKAQRMVAEGHGADLLPWGSFRNGTLSAQTLLDTAQSDVFGLRASDAPIGKVRQPILAFYGTKETGGGGPTELELIRTHATAVPRVDTMMIEDADHFYTGRAPQVGSAIADWLDKLG